MLTRSKRTLPSIEEEMAVFVYHVLCSESAVVLFFKANWDFHLIIPFFSIGYILMSVLTKYISFSLSVNEASR